MNPLSIANLIKAVEGTLLSKGSSDFITGVSTDSRNINRGDLFIPLIGENFDGHSFIEAAVEKGACAVLTHNDEYKDLDANVILVPNTLKALQNLASFYIRQFDIKVIGVTGSTGKTTTKDMIHSVLSTKYKVLKTQGNFNNEIGLPLTIFNIEDYHDFAVLEMGMSGFGEIERLVAIAPPDVGVITNIGVSHIENLGSKENILKAKMELFSQMGKQGAAVLNGDDQLLRSGAEEIDCKVLFYGCAEACNYRAYNIEQDGEYGIRYSVNIDNENHQISLRIPGYHNVYNSLAAVAVGRFFDVDIEDIVEGLAAYIGADMRLKIFTTSGNIKIIDDVYNASPDSMKAAIHTLSDIKGNRKIAVLGDMFELGAYSEKAHRMVGEKAALSSVDYVAAVGKASFYIAEEAVKNGMEKDRVYFFNTNNNAIKWLNDILLPGDVVLVKGSRGMKMEEIVSFIEKRSC